MERIESTQFKSFSQQIDDIEFFQGDTITIPFQFVDFNGDVITLRKTKDSKTYVRWQLCPYGQYQAPLIDIKSDVNNPRSGNVVIDTDTNIVYVNLDSTITKGLIFGKYVQQIVLYYDFGDMAQKEFRRAQGFLNFKPKIDDYN